MKSRRAEHFSTIFTETYYFRAYNEQPWGLLILLHNVEHVEKEKGEREYKGYGCHCKQRKI